MMGWTPPKPLPPSSRPVEFDPVHRERFANIVQFSGEPSVPAPRCAPARAASDCVGCGAPAEPIRCSYCRRPSVDPGQGLNVLRAFCGLGLMTPNEARRVVMPEPPPDRLVREGWWPGPK